MLKPGGYAYCFDVTGITQEADTFTCHHCGSVVFVQPNCSPYDLGGLCRLCDKMICPSCVDRGICDPIERKLERSEARDRALRSYGF